jgi:diketogulonate reductase-like aldo/keto reductase
MGTQANDGHEIGKIVAIDVSYVDTWRAMEECVDLGLVRNIGISSKWRCRPHAKMG